MLAVNTSNSFVELIKPEVVSLKESTLKESTLKESTLKEYISKLLPKSFLETEEWSMVYEYRLQNNYLVKVHQKDVDDGIILFKESAHKNVDITELLLIKPMLMDNDEDLHRENLRHGLYIKNAKIQHIRITIIN